MFWIWGTDYLETPIDAQMLRTQKKEMLVLLVWCLLTHIIFAITSHLNGRELSTRNMWLPELLQWENKKSSTYFIVLNYLQIEFKIELFNEAFD